MDVPALNPLFQQMGEVISGLRALRETVELRQLQSEQLNNLIRIDVASIKRDQRELEEKLECVICVMQHDLEALRAGAGETARSIFDLMGAVQALRKPIAEIIALRSRFAGLFLGVGVVGSAALWAAEPVYRWLIESVLGKN